MAKKKTRRTNHVLSPLDQLRSVAHKSPARDVGKVTVVREEPKDVLAVENTYAFFTKQRPLSWQYYYRQVTIPFFRTGTEEADNVTCRSIIDTLDVNECLAINHLSARIMYRPYPGTGSIKPGYYVQIDNVEIPTIEELDILGRPIRAKFKFNLLSTTTRLYEANVSADRGNFTLPAAYGGLVVSNRDGFSTLNSNVLVNAQSSTTLFILETGDVAVDFDAIDSYVSSPVNPFAYGFLPYDVTEDNAGLRASPKIVFDIRGHKINKNDAELLKEILRTGK